MKLSQITFKAMIILAASVLRADNLVLVEGEGNQINLSGVTIGTPVFAGTGCAKGTVYPLLDLEKGELTVLFDDFFVEAGGSLRLARKNCALSIPIHLPEGVGVALIGERIEGFNYLPDGASTVLNTESFLAGSKGEVLSTHFEGSLEESFSVEKSTTVGDLSQTCCGQDANLRVNTSLRVKTNSYGDYALAAITRMGESSNSLVYQLQFSHCGQ